MSGADRLVVTLNAGSSSLKFAAFHPGATPVLHGQVAPLGEGARLIAGDTDEAWPHGIEGDGLHELLTWIDGHDGTGPLAAVGHRIVTGASGPGLRWWTAPCSPSWRRWCRWPRCTSRTTWLRSGQ